MIQVGLGQLFFQGGRGVEVNHQVSAVSLLCRSLDDCLCICKWV